MEPMYHWHNPVHSGFVNHRKPNFLEKLFGSTHNRKPLLMQAKSNEHSLHETLHMVQKGLTLVQQLIPVWKQYGPLLKHAPFMVDMIKLMMEDEKHDESKIAIDDHDLDKTKYHDLGVSKVNQTKESRHDQLPEPKLYI
ncbi:VrrA/YqfQ family protein [Alkalibacillus sp. S2W]|uniref:VrrA/YqfQ family protein n=1 Tax=Alkalibacillus sp. S2W TaxID=3386553 RepID=UPI00398CBF5A